MAENDLVWSCPRCGQHLREQHRAVSDPAQADRLSCSGCAASFPRRAGVWAFAPDFQPPGFEPGREQHLAELEEGHFWFPPRQRLMSSLLERARPQGRTSEPTGAAIELGCGGGSFLPRLAERFRIVVGVEAYARALDRARHRLPEAVLIQGEATRVPLAGEQFELVAALDVLEHLDPEALLTEARRLARPGGWLLLSVPAFPCLWSELDRAAGHRCRYRRRQLARELADSGWKLVHWTHYQALLFPLVFLSRRLPAARLRRRAHRVERQPHRRLGRLLGAINRLEVRLFHRHSLRWGSSLCALARRA